MSDRIAELEAHRVALTGHCYRMLGSIVDADDAVQETMVRAWKGLEHFEARAALGTWLYRIATNVCLDALAVRKRRGVPVEESPAGRASDPLAARPNAEWVEPIPDALAVPAHGDPAERLALRQSIRLAFVAALQHLPPKQRATLLLADVLGWSAAQIAETLETSVAATTSALQRARATMESRAVRAREPLSGPQAALLERYVAAFERFDVDELTAVLREDAAFSMPPFSLWLEGPAEVGAFLRGPGAACRGSRLVPVAACDSPAFGHYKPTADGGFAPWALVVLELEGDRIAAWTSFLDTATLFPRFGLAPTLAPSRAAAL
jgi:RNA polymerase sigma-70 factor (ECF subfamily)